MNDSIYLKLWDSINCVIASLFLKFGEFYYGYDVIGLENLPENNSSAIFIFYHGMWPCDIYFFNAKCYCLKKRPAFTIIERIMYKFPGLRKYFRTLRIVPGSIDDCVKILNNKSSIILSPGGLREAMFSDHRNYQTMFQGRLGFARIVKQTNVPIIPMFTCNIREAFRLVPFTRSFTEYMYNKYRIPLFLTYGGLPVKLTTVIGEPIHFTPEMSLEDISNLTQIKIKELIERHQTLPGSMLEALKQRFH